MSTKAQLLLACILACIIVLAVPHFTRHVQASATGQPNSGLAPAPLKLQGAAPAVMPASAVAQTQQTTGTASIQVDRQGDVLLLTLVFRDPNGGSTPPRMPKPPTFAIVDSTGKSVHSGAFEFG